MSVAKRRSTILILLVAVVFAGCQFFPSYDPVNITVTVFDPDGSRVEGAEVTVEGPHPFTPVVTAADGTAVLQGVIPDNYDLVVTYPAGAVVPRRVAIWGGGDYEFEVQREITIFDNLQDDIVANWRFQESGNQVLDSSGNGHHGTIEGNVQRVNGRVRQGLRFNGGYVRVPSSDDFNLSDSFTVAVWAQVDTPGNDQKLIGRSSIGDGFILGIQNSGLRPELWAPNHHDFEQGKIESGKWTHLAITFEAGVGMTGYVNGARVAHVDIANPMADNEMDLIFGIAPWNTSSFPFAGAMDEIYIFGRALSADEIQAIYQQTP